MLELRQITKRFGAMEVLNSISLTFEPGIIHSIIGPNGAGKSTLVNIIAGSYKPSSGEVVLGGQRLTGMRKWDIAAAGVGRTYQNIRLFDALTVVENLKVGLYLKERRNVLAEIFGVGRVRERQNQECLSVLDRFELRSYADQRIDTLPYGRQKLLEIVRALMTEPKALLLDEPAAGLNHAETAELRRQLKGLKHPSRVIVLIEHDMDLIMSVSDRVSVLHRGVIIKTGTPKEVAADDDVKEAYLGDDSEIEHIHALARGRRSRRGLRQHHDLAWR